MDFIEVPDFIALLDANTTAVSEILLSFAYHHMSISIPGNFTSSLCANLSLKHKTASFAL
jgi:hypothetical protein